MDLISLESQDLIGEKSQKLNESIQQVQKENKLNVKVERDPKNPMKRDDWEVEKGQIQSNERKVVESILHQISIKLSQNFHLQLGSQNKTPILSLQPRK